MAKQSFDEHAEKYDAWFMINEVVLRSELLLIRHFMNDPGRTLSVGCGSGLFEHMLRENHGIDIRCGVEPADGMANVARERGMDVKRGVATELPYGEEEFDSVLLNGTPSYIDNLELAFQEAHRVLKTGGRIVVADVPAESSYGLLYRLAGTAGSWDDPFLAKSAPPHPYPVEFTLAANWRTTEEKAGLLKAAGFSDMEYAQTLMRHPKYSNDSVEHPIEGYDRGDYVAIRAWKR
ncbi:MAG: methyltransferase domain-containing protein [Candidatus Latescibacterota bacterium]